MKPRIRKAGIILLEIMGLGLGLTIAIVAYALWRAEHGGLSLNYFRNTVARSIEQSLPEGYEARIGSVLLRCDGDNRQVYRLVIEGVKVASVDGEIEAIVPSMVMEMDKNRFFRGQPGISTLMINQPVLSVVRTDMEADQNHQLRSTDLHTQSPFQTVIEHEQFRSYLRQAVINDLHVRYVDPHTGHQWQAENVQLVLSKSVGGDFGVTAHSHFSMGNGEGTADKAGFALDVRFDEANETIDATLSGQTVPVGDIASIISDVPSDIFTPAVSGEAAFIVDLAGRVHKADFVVEAAEGDMRLGEDILPVKTLRFEGHYKPDTRNIGLNEFVFAIGESKGSITGQVGLMPSAEAGEIPAILFDVSASDMVIDTLGLFTDPLALQSLQAAGSYAVTNRSLKVHKLDLDTDGLGIFGDLQFDLPPALGEGPAPSFGLLANLKTSGQITPKRLMTLWPQTLAPNSRQWVKNQISEGYIENLDFKMDLPAGAKDEIGYITDEQLVLDFDIRDTNAEFITGLTPLTEAYGHGILKGNSLFVDVNKARLGNIVVEAGSVSFPAFQPGEKSIHEYRFEARGAARDMLKVLDEPPLGLISRSGLSPEQISGNATVSMLIKRPPKGKRPEGGFVYDGTAVFDNLGFMEIFQDVDLEAASGILNLKTRHMEITGEGLLGVSPVKIGWRQNFYAEDGASSFDVSGVFDAVMADTFGIPTRSFLRGPVPYQLTATGGYRELENFHVDATFDDAAIGFKSFGLEKPAGVPAFASLDAKITDGETEISNLIIKGDGIDIEGRLALEASGRLLSFAFPQFFLEDHADFRAEAERGEQGALNLSLSGAFLDLGPSIVHNFSRNAANTLPADIDGGNAEGQPGADGFDWGRGVRTSMRLDRLGLRNDVVMRDTSLDFYHDGNRIEILNLSGLDMDMDTLSLVLSHDTVSTESPRVVEAQTTDLGTLLEGLFAVTSIKGGQGQLQFALGENRGDIINGSAIATGLRVVEAPLLARLFAAGSFDGLNDLLRNEGIALDRAMANFSVANGQIRFKDSNAIGPSVGLTTNGSVALNGTGNVELSGAVAPIYQVNSFLGNTPLIGDLFVNREGEGVLALSYSISGNVAAPTVTINPLSAFAPGVIRRAFEPAESGKEPDQPEPQE